LGMKRRGLGWMLFRSKVNVVYRLRKHIFLQPGRKFSEYGVSDLVVEFHGSGITGLSRLPRQRAKRRGRKGQHWSVVLILDYFFVLRGRRKE
jgi:hypothetical protein